MNILKPLNFITYRGESSDVNYISIKLLFYSIYSIYLFTYLFIGQTTPHGLKDLNSLTGD